MATATKPTMTFPFLAALLTHPDFREGIADAPQMFADMEERLATETEMIDVVERNLSRRARIQDCRFCQMTNTEPPSYLYALGLVVGMINEGRLHAR